MNRRDFLKTIGATGSVVFAGADKARASGPARDLSRHYGVLVDTTRCVGCRSCERACNQVNVDLPRRLPSYYKDETVLDQRRRMDASAYTVVNRYHEAGGQGRTVFAKFQCMHCLEPACMSACIVGAFSKDPTGAVIYDAWKCIGCRYCIAACPFQVPAYEYENAFDPQVRKCTFCFTERTSQGEVPACVQSCPMEVMTFGPRAEMIALAHRRIGEHPDRYVPHVYGEHEVGGTAWLYLAAVPFDTIDLPVLGTKPIPHHTEPIQHAIFKYFIPPFALYGALGAVMWATKPKKPNLIVEEGDDE